MVIKKQIVVNKSIEDTWDLLGNKFTEAYKYASGVDHSEGSGESFKGASCSERSCTTVIGELKEKITKFSPADYKLSYLAYKGLPSIIKSAHNHWSLEKIDDNKTLVITNPEFDLSFRGKILTPLLKIQMSKLLYEALEDFKHYLEQGVPHQRKIKAMEKYNRKLRNSALLLLIFILNNSIALFGQKPEKSISPDFNFTSQFVEVKGSKIHYVEEGNGQPILFIHGLPTSSYLWRNILGPVSNSGKVIALDLVGYGKSDVPKDKCYDAECQYSYLEGFIDKLNLKSITLVVTDLGSVYGIRYATLHPENIKRLIIMEGAFMPTIDFYKSAPFQAKMTWTLMRNKKRAKKWIYDSPKVQKLALPKMSIRKLSAVEKETYLAPYKEMDKREVVLLGPGPAGFPKKKNLTNESATNSFVIMLNENAEKLKEFKKPILILYCSPGVIGHKKALKYAQKNFANLETKYLGKGKHFIQEDHPQLIAESIVSFLTKN